VQIKEKQEETSSSESDSDSYDDSPCAAPVATASAGDRSPTFRAAASPAGSPMRMHKDELGRAASPGGGGARVGLMHTCQPYVRFDTTLPCLTVWTSRARSLEGMSAGALQLLQLP
jgi:hypothetical protein